MESRKHLAAEKKRCNSHNCAQAVVCTYCDLVGLPEQTALDIAGAYGTGMGNMEGTCGALVGTGKPLRDCPDCVADASEFLEEILGL